MLHNLEFVRSWILVVDFSRWTEQNDALRLSWRPCMKAQWLFHILYYVSLCAIIKAAVTKAQEIVLVILKNKV